MKFHLGKAELLIILIVITYFVFDILNITQYGILNNINTDLLNSLLVPIFVLITTLYYNYSMYNDKNLKENLNSNIQTIMQLYSHKMLHFNHWLYMKKHDDLGMSLFIKDIIKEFVTPPVIKSNLITFKFNDNEIYVENINNFCSLVNDYNFNINEFDKYYVINIRYLHHVYPIFMNKIENLKDDLFFLNSNIINDYRNLDNRVENLYMKVLLFWELYTFDFQGLVVRKNLLTPIFERHNESEFTEKQNYLLNELVTYHNNLHTSNSTYDIEDNYPTAFVHDYIFITEKEFNSTYNFIEKFIHIIEND